MWWKDRGIRRLPTPYMPDARRHQLRSIIRRRAGHILDCAGRQAEEQGPTVADEQAVGEGIQDEDRDNTLDDTGRSVKGENSAGGGTKDGDCEGKGYAGGEAEGGRRYGVVVVQTSIKYYPMQ
ncbi:hypothetical protein H0H81_008676 [Sphagnurus paluster]|uniref:Uncharacterized protein n=1 Tax=Sphagnurus paluster TaxID=117069 RepID=A0A9P7FS13_9AGAR|nr:hypothetical protein H0H81_008676 [Sphagnurus paluster]